jgi:1,4-dihydroxy-6-naphthoate synthase
MSSSPVGKGSPRELEVGYSPCPNDTFTFHALVTGAVPCPGVVWRPLLEDVETLNRLAFARKLPVTKISFHALGRLRGEYALLRSGAALGRGAGPLLVARKGSRLATLREARIAIPGTWTSAALLLRLFEPRAANLIAMPFHEILPAVAGGDLDAGLIIHESRFTYRDHGLELLADLGEWWERESGLPTPLGAIAADRRLDPELEEAIEHALRSSVAHARAHPEESRDYVRRHAQELASDVVERHIALYVNDFSEDLGDEGLRAVKALYAAAEARGILPRYEGPLGIARAP